MYQIGPRATFTAVFLCLLIGHGLTPSAYGAISATRDRDSLAIAEHKKGPSVALVFTVPTGGFYALRPDGTCLDFSAGIQFKGERDILVHGEEFLRRVLAAVYFGRRTRSAAQKLLPAGRLLLVIDLKLGNDRGTGRDRLVVRVFDDGNGPVCERVLDPDTLYILDNERPPDNTVVRVPGDVIGAVEGPGSFGLRARGQVDERSCRWVDVKEERNYYECPLAELARADTVVYRRARGLGPEHRTLVSAIETLGLLDGLLSSTPMFETLLGEFKIEFNRGKPAKDSQKNGFAEIISVVRFDGQHVIRNDKTKVSLTTALGELRREARSLVRGHQPKRVTFSITGYADASGATSKERERCDWEEQLLISAYRVLWAEWLIREWMRDVSQTAALDIERVARGCVIETQQRMVTIQLKSR